MIVGVVTFLLYLMPVVTGALADRFGYKRMFIIAYLAMTPAYYLLGQFTSYSGFFFGYLLVAMGAAIFKPVVVGTVARTTDETNSQLGFGVFYMMVNIGGFFGPLIAGILRNPQPDGSSEWSNIFTASAVWIACNLIWVTFFFKEPTTESKSESKRTIGKVFSDCVEVLGNLRLFICLFGALILLLMAGQGYVTWKNALLYGSSWILLNLLVDLGLWVNERKQGASLLPRMYFGNWRFALYLLILSGFWTSFNQIFLTMNLYIRDFVNTEPLLKTAASVLSFLNLNGWSASVTEYAAAGGQVNPEYLVNIDAGSIVLFQILISLIVQRMGRFPGMIVGITIASIGIGLACISGGGSVGTLHASVWIVIAGIFVFSIGEMMASPTSQEYIGSIAPKDKVAMYMGYYFVAMALGNLFGGVLSGHLYGTFARDHGAPHIMWAIFGGLGILTAIALALYNRFAVVRNSNDQE